MLNSVIFILSFLFLGAGLLFTYRLPHKVNILTNMIVCVITEICLGSFWGLILKILNVPVHLFSMSMLYFILGLIVWICIFFKKRIQTYCFAKIDLFAILGIGVWFLILFIIIFSPEIRNVYRNSDPGEHFAFALRVFDTGKLTNMYFSELYNSLILELLSPFLVRINLYKAFIIGEAFANLLNVLMFYVVASQLLKTRITKLMLPFICLLYFMGWPFFNFIIGGYVYYGWGVTIFIYIIWLLMELYTNADKHYRTILLGLVIEGVYSLLICYCLFIPVLGMVLLTCLISIAHKHKIKISSRLKISVLGICIIVAVLFFFIIFKGYFGGDISFVLNSLKKNGGINKSFFKDFVFLFPAAVYMCSSYVKRKDFNILFLSFCSVMTYVLATFVICLMGYLSPYYFYKAFYLLWLVTWILNVAAIEYFVQKDKLILISYGSIIVIAMLISVTGFDTYLSKEKIVVDEISTRHYASFFPLLDRAEIFTHEEGDAEDKQALLEMSDYINETYTNIADKPPLITSVYYIGIWYYCYTGSDKILVGTEEELADAILNYQEEGRKEVLVHKNTELFHKYNSVLKNYKVIYNNGYYAIYDID